MEIKLTKEELKKLDAMRKEMDSQLKEFKKAAKDVYYDKQNPFYKNELIKNAQLNFANKLETFDKKANKFVKTELKKHNKASKVALGVTILACVGFGIGLLINASRD